VAAKRRGPHRQPYLLRVSLPTRSSFPWLSSTISLPLSHGSPASHKAELQLLHRRCLENAPVVPPRASVAYGPLNGASQCSSNRIPWVPTTKGGTATRSGSACCKPETVSTRSAAASGIQLWRKHLPLVLQSRSPEATCGGRSAPNGGRRCDHRGAPELPMKGSNATMRGRRCYFRWPAMFISGVGAPSRSQHAASGASIDGGIAATSGRQCYFRWAAVLLPVGGGATSGGRQCYFRWVVVLLLVGGGATGGAASGSLGCCKVFRSSSPATVR
jgi:hypothetical protein